MIEADSGKCALYATPPGPARARAEASAFSLMGILSHPSSFQNEPEHVISRTNGMKLWHAFVQNVDPIVKILHIPTAEVEIFTAINQPGSVSKDTLALLYAIYFAAATSLEPDDISKMLDMTQLAALGKFRTHFQKALADTDALENPTVPLLQGLAIYLHIVPSWNSSRASWILNGLALRMALTIGLHTDGDKLGLPPFEAEVRRRVWWHLWARDFRALEDHGINPRLHLPVSTTRMPGNFDDSDLTPGMTELPMPRRDWTRMTFQLVNIEVANAFHQTLPSMSTVFGPGQRMARRDELFEQLRARLAPYFASCHTVVPMQKFGFQIGQAIVHKMDLITRQQVANLETPDDRDSFATEENLDAACVCLEKNIDAWHDELLRPHKWSQRVHPQYFLVLYVLWHLCIRPDSPQASRAWGVVDAMFRVEQQRLANASSGQNVKRVVLERMRAKAEAVRPSTVAAPMNNGVNGTSNDATDAGFAQFSFGAGDLPQGQFYEDLNFDWSESLENMEMPNWNTLPST
ncbi:fungal specific transcription factor domain-containing protein [Sarocladium implicatum]|nr:fungal specific transcription factor domain-containing protein [Sarocladium implicatum]